jgi:predicted RecA/RadA family phage recombinase
MTNYVKPGDVTTRVAPSGGVVSGTAYLIQDLLVVATVTAAEGASFEGMLVGVFTLPKTTGEAWDAGEKLWWDDSTKKLTTTAGSNKIVGTADAAAESADATGNVRLDGVAR